MLLSALATLLTLGQTAAPAPDDYPAPAGPPPVIWLAPPPERGTLEAPEGPAVTLLLPPPPSPDAVALPPSARALLEQAIAKGTPDGFAAVAKLARDMYPAGAAQIDALSAEEAAKVAERQAEAARAKADALAAASFLDNWKGEIEAGGSYTTGNYDAVALYGGLKLHKEGLHWRHAFTGRADYSKSSGTVSTDRDTASYQPQYKFDDRLYAFGLAQFDRDEVLGFGSRFTEGAGIGYTVLPANDLHLDLEAGPALRQTRYARDGERDRLAARGSLNFRWKANSAVQFSETSAIFFETDNANISSVTALDMKLFGPLKTRISYNLTYEKDVPLLSKSFDTITQASLVYSF